MGSDNNWPYFTRCPIVTASRSFYGEGRQVPGIIGSSEGILRVCLLWEEYLSVASGAAAEGPLGWRLDILWGSAGGGCLMIKELPESKI